MAKNRDVETTETEGGFGTGLRAKVKRVQEEIVGVQRLGGLGSFALVLGCLVGYAAVALFHPTRQFLHDLIAGTRLVAVDAKP